MKCDLKDTFSAVAATLPTESEECFALGRGTFGRIPTELQTPRLVVERSSHHYDGLVRRDRLVFYATKEVYRHLGLLVAAVLFSPDPDSVILHLSHPSSQIRHLVIRRVCPDKNSPGYHAVPQVLNYYPNHVVRHPWAHGSVSPKYLPGFFLTNLQECVVSDADWLARDVVVGFGLDEGMARLSELFLDLGQTGSDVNEVDLEGEEGFRGVAPLSCEATFLLPGAFGWDKALTFLDFS